MNPAVPALTTALVVAPLAVHRRLTGLHVKERLVTTAHWLVGAGLLTLAALVAGMVLLIFDVVTDRTTALIACGAVTAALVALLVALPVPVVDAGD